MSLTQSIQTAALKQALAYLDKNPQENLPKLIKVVKKMDVNGSYTNMINGVEAAIQDPNNNWSILANSLWTDIDPHVRKTVFTNYVINAGFRSKPLTDKTREKYGVNVPWAILMDPTSACNLHCTGCWAAEYGNKLNMSLEQLDDIISQGTAMGTYFYIYSGGEPLVRKHDIITLCERHPDCLFLAFTNGTLIDEQFADDMLRVGNFAPAISVEGFGEATDFRRGEGTFDKVSHALQILKSKKLLFGVSCCYTSKNVEVIGSEAYFDWMVDMGAKFCWFFTYMPVGNGAPTDLMVSAEQREFMYHQVREFRKTKPLFTLDFWNDGEYVHGCIAGGRNYLHINANGDIEPCAFIHYSDSNIKEKTLLEAYQSPLFMAYKHGQPFNQNHLRPCPLLDNPEALVTMVTSSKAHSTDLAFPEDVHELSQKCVDKSEKWAVVADELWSKDHPEFDCAHCKVHETVS